ncbi:MAG: hypothetical protein WCX84_05555 [Syntrophales bacterium]|jgi:hypothetical protein|nr:hypothetical protein [Syntrophales bacterium]
MKGPVVIASLTLLLVVMGIVSLTRGKCPVTLTDTGLSFMAKITGSQPLS